jgi:hypothetical protein
MGESRETNGSLRRGPGGRELQRSQVLRSKRSCGALVSALHRAAWGWGVRQSGEGGLKEILGVNENGFTRR